MIIIVIIITNDPLLFYTQVDDLERMIDAPLHVAYLKQLSVLREKALRTFKQTLATTEGTEFEAMMQVLITSRLVVCLCICCSCVFSRSFNLYPSDSDDTIHNY